MSLLKKSVLIIFLVLLADQILKIWVKTHMILGQGEPLLGNWFILHFTENPGMAFGMQFGGMTGKILLSVFRLVFSVVIFVYILKLIRTKAHPWFIYSLSLVFAGAVGNIIDSAFYGMIFNKSHHQIATLFPPEGGYAGFLKGHVVDMLYFPVIEGRFPEWFPFWKGEAFTFFQPVFNIADSAITIGVFIILIFQKRFFQSTKLEEKRA